MIFCVEDDDNIRELVIYTLETTGLEARGFADGTAFMEALAFDTPELVLLDIMLPGEDGLEILKKLKNCSPFLRIRELRITSQGGLVDLCGTDMICSFIHWIHSLHIWVNCVKQQLQR